jgi:hypothetical protein
MTVGMVGRRIWDPSRDFEEDFSRVKYHYLRDKIMSPILQDMKARNETADKGTINTFGQ